MFNANMWAIAAGVRRPFSNERDSLRSFPVLWNLPVPSPCTPHLLHPTPPLLISPACAAPARISPDPPPLAPLCHGWLQLPHLPSQPRCQEPWQPQEALTGGACPRKKTLRYFFCIFSFVPLALLCSFGPLASVPSPC
jgi:hypothetical protein